MTDLISFYPVPDEGSHVVVGSASRDDLVAELGERMAQGVGFTVATLNVDHYVKLHLPKFRELYAGHSHITADGNPIVWFHRLAGRPVPLVPGSELVRPIVAEAARRGVSVALFGSTAEVLERAAIRLTDETPDLKIVEQIAPPQGLNPLGPVADELLDRLAASGAGLCFFALGAPKQEILAMRATKMLPAMGFVSIGAGLDFIAGHRKRAPVWVQRLAMEWAWRLSLEPKRLARRYFNCFLAVPELTLAALRARMRARH